jgi:MFS family permease
MSANGADKEKMLDAGGKNIVCLMTALLVAIFAFQLNSSMLAPALVQIQNELNTSALEVSNSQTIFFTASALFSLFLPRLADLVGRRRVLCGMLLLTGIGCVVSAAAANIEMLSIGRILQGVAGPVVPMCLIMLRDQVREEKRYTRLMAILTSVNGGIAGVDALLGGWLAGTFGFRSVFIVMAAVAVVAVVLVWIFSRESTAAETPKMDWAGAATLGIAFLAVYLAINEAEKLATANWAYVAVGVVVAAVFFVAFWNIEKRKSAPMVSTHYLKQRRTWGLLLTTLLTMTGVFAVMNGIVPAIAQDPDMGVNMGADIVSFATLTPYALLGLAFGPVAGILASKFGYHMVLRGGLVVSILGVVFGIFVSNNPSVVSLVAISVVLGISYAGTANIMLNGLGIMLSPDDNPGYLPGMNAGAFNLGAGLSYAILYAAMNAVAATSGVAAGYEASMIAGIVCLVLALLSSLLIPKKADADNS